MIALASLGRGAESVRLAAQRQKFRTFYALADSRVPAALKEQSAAQPVGNVAVIAVARDGAVWYGTAQGLVRFDSHAGPQAKTQYFAGKRYLHDHEVQQLVADGATGMAWLRHPICLSQAT